MLHTHEEMGVCVSLSLRSVSVILGVYNYQGMPERQEFCSGVIKDQIVGLLFCQNRPELGNYWGAAWVSHV